LSLLLFSFYRDGLSNMITSKTESHHANKLAEIFDH
jgi:hypothetical protein